MKGAGGRSASRRLRPGAHGIPADVVARNQRERLIAAMAEVCAERSYAEIAIADVVKRAGVSSVTFYQQFADKRDCLLAAHRQLLGRLLEAIDDASEVAGDEESRGRTALDSMLPLLAADPPAARLLTVEILAGGPEGAKRHEAMVAAVAERIGSTWVAAAGVLALIGDRVAGGEAARLPTLGDELAAALAAGRH